MNKPKRFWSNVALFAENEGFSVQLDGRTAQTPARKPLWIKDKLLAEKVAQEWREVKTYINPSLMPFTKLVITALDAVSDKIAEVRDDACRYGMRDLLCYRAQHPQKLVSLQAECWDPLLDWLAQTYCLTLRKTDGLMPIEQDEAVLPALIKAVDEIIAHDALKLAAFHSITTLSGSYVIALAVARCFQDASLAWRVATIDEQFNVDQWGQDEEAAKMQNHKQNDFNAACFILQN